MTPLLRRQDVFLLGLGGVGRSLARQLLAARPAHAARRHVRLDVIGVADSRGAVFQPGGFDDAALAALLDRKERGEALGSPLSPLPEVAARLPPGAILVDTTATDQVVPVLLAARAAGCGIVLANKLPLAGPLTWYDAIASGPARWETTVGAAMPVIATLNYLLDSGDAVQRIEGSLSGTLGFIAAQLEAGVPFGDAVREAKQRGYTEPDPRQDLGGRDAARKALILARMLGGRLEMADVSVESLYPAAMDALTVEEFLREVDALNAPMAARAAALTAGGRRLRYAAVVEGGRCRVELLGADPAGKLGGIRASDSVVVFTTRCYRDNPLAISGRGAGQEVTASGVLGDIVSLSSGDPFRNASAARIVGG